MEIDFSKDILSIPDMDKFDTQLNPSFYIHYGLITSQRVLLMAVAQGKMHDGILAYNTLIEHMETLIRASGNLNKIQHDDEDEEVPLSYDEKIDRYITTDKSYQTASNESVRMAKLSNFKLLLLMETMFGDAMVTAALKDTPYKKVFQMKKEKQQSEIDKINKPDNLPEETNGEG